MDVNRDEITEIYKKMYKLLLNREYDKCDDLLNEYDPELLNLVLLVGLPRLTFVYRNDLEQWGEFLEKAQTEIKKRGHDPAELLKGLI